MAPWSCNLLYWLTFLISLSFIYCDVHVYWLFLSVHLCTCKLQLFRFITGLEELVVAVHLLLVSSTSTYLFDFTLIGISVILACSPLMMRLWLFNKIAESWILKATVVGLKNQLIWLRLVVHYIHLLELIWTASCASWTKWLLHPLILHRLFEQGVVSIFIWILYHQTIVYMLICVVVVACRAKSVGCVDLRRKSWVSFRRLFLGR